MDFGVRLALPSSAEKAMAKQPAWAAAMSSSGLVPAPFSKRVPKEYWVCLRTPLSLEMVPLPSLSPPCQMADALRLIINCSFDCCIVPPLELGNNRAARERSNRDFTTKSTKNGGEGVWKMKTLIDILRLLFHTLDCGRARDQHYHTRCRALHVDLAVTPNFEQAGLARRRADVDSISGDLRYDLCVDHIRWSPAQSWFSRFAVFHDCGFYFILGFVWAWFRGYPPALRIHRA